MCKRNMKIPDPDYKRWYHNLTDMNASAETLLAVTLIFLERNTVKLLEDKKRLEAELSKMAQHVDELLKPSVNDDVVAGSAKHLALDWHNPDGVDSPGEGYRFMLKTEKRKDATHFFGAISKQWRPMPDYIRTDNLNQRVTYRTDKPLPDDIN